MDLKSFQLAMRTISAVTPYATKMQDEELQFLYYLVPQKVRTAVTDGLWAYACNKALFDPSPNKEIPLHLRVLSYVYRVENGTPNFDWGLKEEVKGLLPPSSDLKQLPDAE